MEIEYKLKEEYITEKSEARKPVIKEMSLYLFEGDEIVDWQIAKQLKDNEWEAICKKHSWYYIKKYTL